HGIRAGWRLLMYGLIWIVLVRGLDPLSARFFPPQAMMDDILVMLVASLVAGWVMLAAVDRRPMGALGFALDPAAGRDSAVGFGVGAAMLGCAVILLTVAGMARWVADTGSVWEYVAALAQALAFFAVAAAAEEVAFRGYAFQALVQGIGAWPAAVLTSALFAYGHAGNPEVNAVALANIFLAGVMLAVAYLKTRSLWFATAVHLGWNWTMQSLLGFPVSGLNEFDTPLYDVRELGPDAVTGGPFGPEAGIAATLAILAGTVWMWRTRRLRESERMMALRPLVDTKLGPGWGG
ncbi:CPBP family intramembrane glutamic endopeptidase, partial [Longimicrobium sp.]|uniref:CPBP family intramembrane glutamic endopeptidase n=1 Tax=Longimicrobium sp. TaxID=2029185 RepID=UPI002E30ADF5